MLKGGRATSWRDAVATRVDTWNTLKQEARALRSERCFDYAKLSTFDLLK